MEFQTQLGKYQDFLKNESIHLKANFKKLRVIKQNAVDLIEKYKYELRRKYNPFAFPQVKSNEKNSFGNSFSVKKLQDVLIVMDYDIGLIQNQFDVIYNDLVFLKMDIEKTVKKIETSELVQNLLNYRMYEIQYDFMTKIKEIRDKRRKVESGTGNVSQIALAIVDLDKELIDCENAHDSSFQVAKEQKLEAQEAYESLLNFMDDILDIYRRHYHNLVLLLEAEKSLDQPQNEHVMALDELEQQLELYTKKQAEGWKVKPVRDIADIPKGLRLTQVGLLLSQSGKHIAYQEVESKRLLDNMEYYERVDEQDMYFDDDEENSGESLQENMSSEDVIYLKKHLGIPLTLALAEVTAVQPRDPIHYLGHWLFKYRYNQEMSDIRRIELEHLLDERKKVAATKWQAFVENEARTAVIDMIMKAEEEAMKNELIKIQTESQEEYDDDLEYEARDKFDTYN